MAKPGAKTEMTGKEIKENTLRRKRNKKDIDTLAREALEHGMSYGQYVAYLEMGVKKE